MGASSRSLFATVALLASLAVAPCLADLPVHCVDDQVFGEWTFHIGPASGDPSISCGHQQPDQVMTMVQKKVSVMNPGFPILAKVQWNLEAPNPKSPLPRGIPVTKGKQQVGHWTMVYDEGMEVEVNGYRYFTFFAYSPKSADSDPNKVEEFNSHCDRTYSGWFHPVAKDASHKNWGCFLATRTDTRRPIMVPTGHLRSGQQVLSPTAGFRFASQDWRQHARSLWQSPLFHQSSIFVELVNNDPTSSWTARLHDHLEQIPVTHASAMMGHRKFSKSPMSMFPAGHTHARFQSLHHRQQLRDKVNAVFAARPNLNWAKEDGGIYATPVVDQGACGSCWSIAATEAASMRLRIQKKWTGALSIQAALGCSIYNQGCDGGYPYLAGKFGYDLGYVTASCLSYTPGVHQCASLPATCSAAHGGPAFLELASADGEAVGGAGAVAGAGAGAGTGASGTSSLAATNAAAAARSAGATVTDEAAAASAKAASASAFYASASDGGASYSKFDNHYRFADYSYVGGSYGACSHDAMILALQKGPIPIAFDAPSTFFSYAGGIFDLPGSKTPDNYYVHGASKWIKTNHAVVCVGYGTDPIHGPYWIAKNSWGEKWGDHGYFRIRRVVDDHTPETWGGLLGFQSMAVEIDV